ncbi:MAG: DUF1194 domain-containing protein [Pelagimonas sp.]
MRRALALLLALWPLSAGAQDCRLALLLALDVSSSIDEIEYAQQRDGLAAALLSEDVRGAILSGGGIALSAYEWSGRYRTRVILPWVMLSDPQDIVKAASDIQSTHRQRGGYPTALGLAVGDGIGMFKTSPTCDRKVLDVSGDGITNDGAWPQVIYSRLPDANVTVNGLAVLGADPDVVDHYTDELIHGPGSFVEIATGYAGYEQAITRKLYREIENRVVGALK